MLGKPAKRCLCKWYEQAVNEEHTTGEELRNKSDSSLHKAVFPGRASIFRCCQIVDEDMGKLMFELLRRHIPGSSDFAHCQACL